MSDGQGSGDFAIGGSGMWAGVGKLIEECGEACQVMGKIIGASGRRAHWDGTDLRTRLEGEIADVLAAASFVIEANDLDRAHILEVQVHKLDLFRQWDREQSSCPDRSVLGLGPLAAALGVVASLPLAPAAVLGIGALEEGPATDEPFRPNWVSPPGESIRDAMEAGGVTVGELQLALGLEDAGPLFRGEIGIDDGLALQLEKFLGGSARFWMNRDSRYRADVVRFERKMRKALETIAEMGQDVGGQAPALVAACAPYAARVLSELGRPEPTEPSDTVYAK